MRRCALLLFAGVPSLLGAQGFGVYEHNACTMARGGVAAASPCADGSAIFFNPAGLAGLSGNHLSGGITIIAATGNFTEDIIGTHSDIDPQKIPVPNAFITHAFSPKLTVGFGFYVPYGLEVKWPSTSLGRFIGYDTKVKALYFQPTVGYQVTPKIKLGLGVAYIHSTVELHQHADLSAQPVAPGITFGMLGIPTNTDFVDAALTGSGNGIALNGGII